MNLRKQFEKQNKDKLYIKENNVLIKKDLRAIEIMYIKWLEVYVYKLKGIKSQQLEFNFKE